MIKQEEVFRIGKIGKPHGVKGEVSFMFDDDVFDRVDADYLVLQVDGILVPFFFEEYRFKSGETALIKFCDIDTKERAQELTGCEVFFPKSLSDRDESELCLQDTEGFTLVNGADEDRIIGTVTYVDDSTQNILFNVRTPEGKDILIPAADEFITNVDVGNRTITVNLPEGLLEISSP